MRTTVRYHGSEVPVTEPASEIAPLLEQAGIDFTWSEDHTVIYVESDGGDRAPYTLYYDGSVFVWGPNGLGGITSSPDYTVKRFVEHYRSMQRIWKHLRHDAAWGKRLDEAGIEFGWNYQGPQHINEPGDPHTRYRYYVGFSRPGEHRPGQPKLSRGMVYHWWAHEVFQKIITESDEREKQAAELLAVLLDQMFRWTRTHRDIEKRIAWRHERGDSELEIDVAAFREWLGNHHVEWGESWSPTVNTGGTYERRAPKDQLWWWNQFIPERLAVREFEMVVGAELLETWLQLDQQKWEN